MCYDRTSIGKKPMCATVCPSQALYYGTRDELVKMRRETPVNDFVFGQQRVRTKVNLMSAPDAQELDFDIMNFMPDTEAEPDIYADDLGVWTESNGR
jgi:Fe-S-cluster-containing dehydrogenase component